MSERAPSRVIAWQTVAVALRAGVMVAVLWGGAPGALHAEEALAVQDLGEGVYAHRGQTGDYAPENGGDLANLGFVVGQRCVAVIDSGGSFRVGQRLRAAIRRVTPLPVCYVVLTHVHPDHLFGSAAFMEDRPEFVGHDHLAAALGQRGPTYLRALQRNLGDLAQGSEIIPPTRAVKDRLDLDLGGRTLQVKAWRTAHTDNDVTVFDPGSGTMFMSDLLFADHTPVVDGSLKGWLDVIGELRSMTLRQVVPGHGPIPAPWPQSLENEARYLNVLLTEVRQALKERRTIQQAVETVGLSEKDRWLVFELFHRRNVTASYAELEWED